MRSSRLVVAASAAAVLGSACASPTPHALSASPPAAARSSPPEVSISASTETWTLPAAVSRAVVLPDRSGFVVLGGLGAGDTSTSRIVQVDPASGNSGIAGNLAAAVHDSAGAVIDGRFFVFGGGSTSTVPTVQTWTAGPATEVARLPEARSDLSATTLDGTTYIVGGYDGSAMSPDVLATTDGESFRPVARLAMPVRYAAVAGFGSTLWVVGGLTSTSEGGTTDTDAVQKVDVVTGQVAVVGRLPQPIGHAMALLLGGQIFVVGGRSGDVPSATIFRLDPVSGALTLAGQLPQAMSDAGSVVVGGVGYLVGGEITGPGEPLDTVVALHVGRPPGS